MHIHSVMTTTVRLINIFITLPSYHQPHFLSFKILFCCLVFWLSHLYISSLLIRSKHFTGPWFLSNWGSPWQGDQSLEENQLFLILTFWGTLRHSFDPLGLTIIQSERAKFNEHQRHFWIQQALFLLWLSFVLSFLFPNQCGTLTRLKYTAFD